MSKIHLTVDRYYYIQAPSAIIIFPVQPNIRFLFRAQIPLFIRLRGVFMNIIEPGVTLNPNTTRLVHCKACDATWADRKIPKVCPHCGAPKSKLAGAKEEECESFMYEYMEMMSCAPEGEVVRTGRNQYDSQVSRYDDRLSYRKSRDSQHSRHNDTDVYCDDDQTSRWNSFTPGNRSAAEDPYEAYYSDCEPSHRPYHSSARVYSSGPRYQEHSASDDSPDDYFEEYEPIGYDPDDFMNNMIERSKISNLEKREMLLSAQSRVMETKQIMRSAGLPTDSLQAVMQNVKSQANKLGKNIPGYIDLLLKVIVDTTLQQELKHPRSGWKYSLTDVKEILQTLGIKEDYWSSYYRIAGIMSA